MCERKGPYKKGTCGKFQVSLFKTERIVRLGDDFRPERIIEQVRVCIQYSFFRRSTNSWEREQIWCSPEELRDLSNAILGIAYVTPSERIP